jgi:hypothetical protein
MGALERRMVQHAQKPHLGSVSRPKPPMSSRAYAPAPYTAPFSAPFDNTFRPSVYEERQPRGDPYPGYPMPPPPRPPPVPSAYANPRSQPAVPPVPPVTSDTGPSRFQRAMQVVPYTGRNSGRWEPQQPVPNDEADEPKSPRSGSVKSYFTLPEEERSTSPTENWDGESFIEEVETPKLSPVMDKPEVNKSDLKKKKKKKHTETKSRKAPSPDLASETISRHSYSPEEGTPASPTNSWYEQSIIEEFETPKLSPVMDELEIDETESKKRRKEKKSRKAPSPDQASETSSRHRTRRSTPHSTSFRDDVSRSSRSSRHRR